MDVEKMSAGSTEMLLNEPKDQCECILCFAQLDAIRKLALNSFVLAQFVKWPVVCFVWHVIHENFVCSCAVVEH
jgi:hypothetical protein